MTLKTLALALIGSLSAGHAFADTTVLKSARGSVLIAAPTALNGPSVQGVWFINPATKAFSLHLPELPSDRVYEGWIVDACTGTKISTGLFRAHGGIDADAAGMYKGPLALNFPPVPGSDFVTLKQDLADGGHKIVITVEPYPDSDPNPSSVVVLHGDIPAGVSVGTEITLTNVAH